MGLSAKEFLVGTLAELKSAIDYIAGFIIEIDGDRALYPGGNNGPHYALETPLRNTAHAALLYNYAWMIFGENSYREISKRLYRWILLPGNIHVDKGFVFRQAGSLNTSNGVIGPAWLLESLLAAKNVGLDTSETANCLIKRLRFSKTAKAWAYMSGKRWKIDYTLDHQLWFACAMHLSGEANDTSLFLDMLDEGGLKISRKGIISHLLYTPTARGMARGIYFQMRKNLMESAYLESVEMAYQHYTLAPIALLKMTGCEHKILNCTTVLKAVSVITEEFIETLRDNRLGYYYNCSALELLPLKYAYEDVIGVSWEYLHDEFHGFCIELMSGKMARSAYSDYLTLVARLYEFARSYYIVRKGIGIEGDSE